MTENSCASASGAEKTSVCEAASNSHDSTIPNVLAQRYASAEMVEIWNRRARIIAERELWIAVMKAQAVLGVDIEPHVIGDYESVIDQVDLDSIDRRERVLRHDVKARIDEFCDLAGHEQIHRAMTSRDLTENVEQMQVLKSLYLVRERSVTVAVALAGLVERYKDQPMVGRSHNVAAQVTTLGKRFASILDEHLGAFNRLEALIDSYRLRGMKGPVGTQQDLLDLFNGANVEVAQFEQAVASHLGFRATFDSVGQVYPRSSDFDVVSALVQLSAAPSSLATTVRLMAGHDLVTEGFVQGQVGSSAMPHKMNARSCERVNGFATILKGHLTMASGLIGSQWNEGDVSCSVVRRVVLPDAFFALDGLYETLLVVLDGFGAFPAVINAELQRYLPFLATTRLLTAAVGKGDGRESAHEVIKKHAVAAALQMRGSSPGGTTSNLNSGSLQNSLAESLGADEQFALSFEEVRQAIGEPIAMTGTAISQCDAVVRAASELAVMYPEAADYLPKSIL